MNRLIHPLRKMVLCVAALCCVTSGSHYSAGAGEQRMPLESGPAAGATVHQFFVRAVTGPHRNRSICYVCRYGDRPVVMVFLQGVDPNVAKLLKVIDQAADAGRAEGIRSFGVLVSDDSGKVVSTLQTMAFDEKIELPLTAATTAIAGPSCHNLHPDATTTIVLYRNQKVVSTSAFRRGELTDAAIETVEGRLRQFASPERD